MIFTHSDEIWTKHPHLGAAAAYITGTINAEDVAETQRALLDTAMQSIDDRKESDLEPIKAWRQAYAEMGHKPTQYRCASESLLRRLRRDGGLPAINPFVDFCNALSVAWAMPVAAFDVNRISGDLLVRGASGQETYQSFDGQLERPEPGEVIFADDGGNAHARRWAHRQSALSAITPASQEVLVVVEGHHSGAAGDASALLEKFARTLEQVDSARMISYAQLNPDSRIFAVTDA